MKSCILCDKIYCKMCDYQVHMIKANSHHKRSKIYQAEHIINKCSIHDCKLLFFCETCNKAICEICKKEGKHSSKLHSISNITDSFTNKFNNLNSFVSKDLMTKYVKLHEQINNIEILCEKVRENSMKIEKEIKEEYLKLIQCLKYNFCN